MIFRLRLTALVLLLATLATPLSVFATAAQTDPCVTSRHDCDDVPTIIECCCDDASGSGPATPAEQRVTVTAAAALTAPDVFDAVSIVRIQPAAEHVSTFSPRTCLLDLPTLFATFLI